MRFSHTCLASARPRLAVLEERAVPATFTVNSINDTGAGTGPAGDLRYCVAQANATPGADDIVFDPVLFATPRSILKGFAPWSVTDSVRILGPGTGLVTLRGGGGVGGEFIRSFNAPGLAVELSGLTLRDNVGSNSFGGGAVSAANCDLTLRHCAFVNNRTFSTSEDGGAVFFTGGTLTVEACTFANNRAQGSGLSSYGGAVYAEYADVVIRDSLITGNTAICGGGVCVGGGAVDIERCTFTGNSGAGAAFYSPSSFFVSGGVTLSVRNSTISANTGSPAVFVQNHPGQEVRIESSTITGTTNGTVPTGGLKVYGTTTPTTVTNSIISGNASSTLFDISSPGSVSVGHCAVGSADGFTLTDLGGNLPFGADLKLGPLADNGGPTPTHALLPGSPAIDAGEPTTLTTDQRGLARVSGAAADIGAYERQPLQSTVTVNDGAAQRSRVTFIDVVFNQPVTLPANPADAFRLLQLGPPPLTPVGLTAQVLSPAAVRLTFSGPLVEFGSLRDGRYRLTVFAAQVGGPGGVALPADVSADLHRLFGDADGDADVDAADFATFRTAVADDDLAFDFDGDGDVDAVDFSAFRPRFGVSLP